MIYYEGMKYCGQCIYYEVTWQPSAPHGCRAYGFITSGQPDQVVLRNTGLPCQLHTPRGEGSRKSSSTTSRSADQGAVSVKFSKRNRR